MNEQNINPGIFGLGNPNNAYSQYFSGRSWLKMLTVERLVTANVTFEAGCRNNWHVHHKGGQILLVTAGRGWYQPENRGIYTQSDSSKKSSRNIWSLAVVSVDQRY